MSQLNLNDPVINSSPSNLYQNRNNILAFELINDYNINNNVSIWSYNSESINIAPSVHLSPLSLDYSLSTTIIDNRNWISLKNYLDDFINHKIPLLNNEDITVAFYDAVWNSNLSKFTQNPVLADLLLSTGNYMLYDNSNSLSTLFDYNIDQSNTLGHILMTIRQYLRNK